MLEQSKVQGEAERGTRAQRAGSIGRHLDLILNGSEEPLKESEPGATWSRSALSIVKRMDLVPEPGFELARVYSSDLHLVS